MESEWNNIFPIEHTAEMWLLTGKQICRIT